MTAFLVGAALLVGLALAFLLWPLLRGKSRAGGRDQAIASVYRDQYRELSAEHAAGNIDAGQFESGRRELERRLLEEVAQVTSAGVAERKPVLTAVLIAAIVVAVPAALYLRLGQPAAISPVPSESAAAGEGGAGQKGAPHAITQEQVQAMIDQLAKRLEQNPKDGDGWAMLARSYAYVRKFPEAVKAYATATQLAPADAHLLADYADALAMTNERRLTGEPMKLIARALALNPEEIKALALAGSEAFDRHDYKAAVGFWERAVKAGPPDPQFADQLRSGIQEARQLGAMGAAAPSGAKAPSASDATAPSQSASSDSPAPAAPGGKAFVKGRVSLAPAFAGKAAPTDTVFIFARATQGPRVPLALLKRQVKDLPMQFALDETMSMMPDMNLSRFAAVVIGARVSHSGDAIASSGDLQGFSAPVKVGSTDVQVQIDQVVP